MQEIKYSTAVSVGNVTDSFTGLVVRLNPLIPQGVTKNSRLGTKIRFKHFQWRLIWNSIENVGNPGVPLVQQYRILILQPRILPAAGLAIGLSNAEVFDNATTGTQCVVSSIRNNNCRVLYDKTFSNAVGYGAGASIGGNPVARHAKLKIRINNNCNFDSNIATLPTDVKDNYYMMMVSDAIVNEVNFNWSISTRLSFYDM